MWRPARPPADRRAGGGGVAGRSGPPRRPPPPRLPLPAGGHRRGGRERAVRSRGATAERTAGRSDRRTGTPRRAQRARELADAVDPPVRPSACPTLSCGYIDESPRKEVKRVTAPPRFVSHGMLPRPRSLLTQGDGKPPSWGQRLEALKYVPPLLRLVYRSEEHTSELQSPCNLVCRLLLE